jgi:hypothetical protein
MKDEPFGDLPKDQQYTELREDNLEYALSVIKDSGEKVFLY